jgi:ribonuclease D
MQAEIARYQLIEDTEGLKAFAKQNENIEWVCFDTEFIGEKRFITTLCLIQVGTKHGFFLIDPLKVNDLQPLIDMLLDERILKIVHAGDNDYRLFNTHFGIIPKNTFDTQIAAAFAGYKYPVAFSKLVESELKIVVSKGYTVTDWEKRPFQKKQLKYALHDVFYLHDLWHKLSAKLERLGRLDWVYEEMKELENPENYEQDPYKEALESNLIKSLRTKEQIFLIRLLDWRREEARKKNHSREMVLPGKYISAIVRAVHSGMEALRQNRRLSNSLIDRYGEAFIDMYQRQAEPFEKELLTKIPRDNSDNPKQDILMEMLDLLVRYKCYEHGISHHMVMPRSALKRMKNDKDYFDPTLDMSWRRKFLGEEIIDWFNKRSHLEIDFTNGKFELKMKAEV